MALGIAVIVAAPLLVGCAPLPPKTGWSPPGWGDPGTGHVTVASGPTAGGSEASAPASDAEASDAEASDAAASDAAVAVSDLVTPGASTGRIRNDGVRLQARTISLPGDDAFNARVMAIVLAAISRSGATYLPEVFPASAGLSERGCIPGVLARPAAQVLADPATGPVDGTGTAIVCEITSAFDRVVGVSFRTVSGSPTGVDDDHTQTLFADLATGGLLEGDALWSDAAAPALWALVMSERRREVGGLSTAPLAAASDEQAALAARGLESVGYTPDGGATFVMPPGLTAPELEQLGAPATTEPLRVTVDAATLAGWESDAAVALFARKETPFAGLPAWRADRPVDCAFLACVAVTYDDGPSPNTPRLLETLTAAQAPATFFMLGPAAQGQRDVVAAAANAGFEIGSHTMSHTDLTTLSPRKAKAEVIGAEQILSGITGHGISIYRPPYGAVNDAVIQAVGQPAVLWTVDTLDWKDPGPDELVKRSVDVAKPGDIILFHDTHAGSVDAAARVMQGLRDRGFTPVTVSTLLGGAVPQGRVFGR